MDLVLCYKITVQSQLQMHGWNPYAPCERLQLFLELAFLFVCGLL